MARQTTDYSRAASAVVNNMDAIYGASQRNKMDPGKIAMEIDDANTARYKAFIRTAGDLATTKISNDSRLDQYQETVDAGKEIEKIKKPARMAGKLAALGNTGIGFMAYKQMRDEDRKLQDAADARLDKLDELINQRQNRPEETIEVDPELNEALKPLGYQYDESGKLTPIPKGSNGVADNTEPEKPVTVVAPAETGVTLETTKPSEGSNKYSMDLGKLTDQDWKELSFVVSGEAERGTDDEFGVAASVLNRVQSSAYPNTVGEVARQPKQYHAVTIGNARYDDELASKLSSPDGILKLQSALETLAGRTDFKGQAMLHNRVADEDPMFSSKGNYYHYNYQ